MPQSSKQFTILRRKHPRIIYRGFEYRYQPTQGSEEGKFWAKWQFELETFESQQQLESVVFAPELEFAGPLTLDQDVQLDSLVFELGLVELISYWKAACPPKIEIAAGQLTPEQVAWWQELLIKGLGEFFYTNGIDFTQPDLVKWQVATTAPNWPNPLDIKLDQNRYLLPVGGGKDSLVSLAVMRQLPPPAELQLWAVDPIPASRAAADIVQLPLQLISRRLDPKLLELNRQGYLNGHTPYSAFLAFAMSLVAATTQSRWIVLSNELSANEPNTTYKGHAINHQFSKSFEFEQAFRSYSQRHLLPGLEYLSLLRPLHELQIAQAFSKLPDFFSTFKSCNQGRKLGDIWCHHCPKCLFAFCMLFPFIDRATLTTQIFNHNLFEDASLLETGLKLVTPDREKPFECVGSYEESKVAVWLATQQYVQDHEILPVVVDAIKAQVLDQESNWEKRSQAILEHWNHQHFLPAHLVNQLEDFLHHAK